MISIVNVRSSVRLVVKNLNFDENFDNKMFNHKKTILSCFQGFQVAQVSNLSCCIHTLLEACWLGKVNKGNQLILEALGWRVQGSEPHKVFFSENLVAVYLSRLNWTSIPRQRWNIYSIICGTWAYFEINKGALWSDQCLRNYQVN